MNYDEIIKEMEAFQRKVMGSMLDDFGDFRRLKPFEAFENERDEADGGFYGIFKELEKGFQSEMPQGEWRFERIDRPGVKGFTARGIITRPELLKKPEDVLPPLRPEPGRPRRPLYDIQAEDGQLRIYIELPGVDENDINIEVMDRKLRLHAGDFEEEIDLNRWIVDPDKLVTKYGNGVLEVTIPTEDLEEQMV
jgi:HSP20 family molecular chaperone IbpA